MPSKFGVGNALVHAAGIPVGHDGVAVRELDEMKMFLIPNSLRQHGAMDVFDFLRFARVAVPAFLYHNERGALIRW